jgi:hypothetical protein
VREAILRGSDGSNSKESSADPHETRLDSRANLDRWKSRLSRAEVDRVRALTEEAAAAYYPCLEWA